MKPMNFKASQMASLPLISLLKLRLVEVKSVMSAIKELTGICGHAKRKFSSAQELAAQNAGEVLSNKSPFFLTLDFIARERLKKTRALPTQRVI